MDEGRIGVDESGKGDFFGPLVVAACYVGPEHLAELEGVRDSKKLTDKQADQLARRILRVCPNAVVTIPPAKYNELYAKIGNLNRLLAWAHGRAIENLLQKQDANLVVSDQFATPELLRSRLQALGRQANVVSRTKAESDIAVAAASVLARAKFLWQLGDLSQEWGIQLPKGCGRNVLEAGREFVRRHGESSLGQVAKLHFKTRDDILADRA
ncbi:MAG TPA: ribonuclease HIII [Armatimonadetes bacterium]|nr:ribonuclease HIII [Armatimonadota bacterium]